MFDIPLKLNGKCFYLFLKIGYSNIAEISFVNSKYSYIFVVGKNQKLTPLSFRNIQVNGIIDVRRSPPEHCITM